MERQLEEQSDTEEEHAVGLSKSGRPMGVEIGWLGEQQRCLPCGTKLILRPLCLLPPSCANWDHLPPGFGLAAPLGYHQIYTQGCPRADQKGGHLLLGTALWAVPDPPQKGGQPRRCREGDTAKGYGDMRWEGTSSPAWAGEMLRAVVWVLGL